MPCGWERWRRRAWASLASFELRFQIRSTEEVRSLYGVDRVYYVDELRQYFTDLDPDVIYTLRGKNTDSGAILPPAHFDVCPRRRI